VETGVVPEDGALNMPITASGTTERVEVVPRILARTTAEEADVHESEWPTAEA
jgi:hypothetical protein